MRVMSDETFMQQRVEMISGCLAEAGVSIEGDSTAIMPYLIPVLDTPRKIKGFVRQLQIKDTRTIDSVGVSALEASNIRLRLMLVTRPAGLRLEDVGNSAEIELFRFLNRRVIDVRESQINL